MAGSAFETDGAGAVLREYITLGGATIAIVDAAGVSYVHDDHLATPQVMTDGAAAVAWDASYRPFGEASIAGAAANAQRFPGQTADAETGWHDNWHRTYDPALGRYLQSDPIGLAGGFNTYAYAGGNPVMYADPTGQFLPALILAVELMDLGFKAYLVGLEVYAIYETYQTVMARYQAGCEVRHLVGFWDVVTLVPALRYVRMAGRLAGAGKGAGRFLGRFLADETGSVRLPGGGGYGPRGEYPYASLNGMPVSEAKRHVSNWGPGTYDDVFGSIRDHAARKGFGGDVGQYLRKADEFYRNRRQAIRSFNPETGTTTYMKNRQYIQIRKGKFVSYGYND